MNNNLEVLTMKIGIFTDTYRPQINGVVTSVCLMEQKLKEHGHEPFIFTIAHPHVKPSQDPSNVFRIGSVTFWGNPDYRIAKIYSRGTLKKVQELKIDLIHSHAPFSLGIMAHLIAKKLEIPEIHTYHTMLSDYTHYIKFGGLMPKLAAENYSRVFCNLVNAIIVPTKKVYQTLKDYGVKTPIYIIPTGIELSLFYKEIPKQELLILKDNLKLSENDQILIFVGRIAKEKSIEKLINYHKKLVSKDPHYKLIIVGSGDYLKKLTELVESLSLEDHIVFPGKVNYNDLPKYYQIADCFVTASTSETQGLVVLEAAASGLPIVAIDDESYYDMIQHGKNGFYYHHEGEYISYLETIFRDQKLKTQMMDYSRKIADNFSSESFYNRIMSVYQKTIGQ